MKRYSPVDTGNRIGMLPILLSIALLALLAPHRVAGQAEDMETGGPTAVFTGLAQAPEANLFAGSATTAVPIDVPPGRKGVTPQLALRYQSGAGPSAYGHGWDLPLGRIRRTTRAGVLACTDTERQREFVVELPGASVECRLDNLGTARVACRPVVEESYLRIFLTPAQNRWDVWDKGGVHYVFGVDAAARTGSARDRPWIVGNPCRYTNSWALEQLADSNGNHVDIAYEHADGVAYPRHLRYGGNVVAGTNHSFEVRFVWQDRAPEDRPTNAAGGHLARLTRLLDRVEVSHPVGGVPVRIYDLTYDVDLETESLSARLGFLQAVTLIGRNGVALARHDGLPASTNFAYRQASAASRSFVERQLAVPPTHGLAVLHETNASNHHVEVNVALRDMNGDGFTDLVDARACDRHTDPVWQVFLGSADGFADAPVAWHTVPGVTHRCAITYTAVDQRDGETLHETLDLDGDGIPDWIDATRQPWRVHLGRQQPGGGGGFDVSIEWPAVVQSTDFLGNIVIVPALRASANQRDWIDLIDWNGDGLLDLVNALEGRVRYNTGRGFEAIGVAVAFPAARLRQTEAQRVTDALYDMNGDGLPDHVRAISGDAWEIRLHDGRTLAASPEIWSVPRTCAQGLRDRTGRTDTWRDLIDINGDGLPDLVDTCGWVPEAPYWDVYLNGGTHFGAVAERWRSPHARLRLESRGHTGRLHRDLVDVDGDGFVDLVEMPAAGSGAMRVHHNGSGYWQVACSGTCLAPHLNAAAADALVAIENGVGARTTLSYGPSTLWDNTDTAGIARLPSVLWTLMRIAQDSGMNGIGGNPRRNLEIRYAYGLFDAPTREFRGFGTVQTIEVDGIRETTTFGQEVANKGRVLSTSLHAGGVQIGVGPPLRSTANDWQCFDPDNGADRGCEETPAAAGRTGIRLASTHVYEYGTDGTRRHAWREQREWDDYGNALHVRVGGDASLTVDTYSEFAYADDLDPGGTRYQVAKPIRVRVASGSTVEEKWLFYDDLGLGSVGRGNLTRIESWLSSSVVPAPSCTAAPKSSCVTTEMAYDDYGNVIAVVDSEGRATSTDYDATRIHPVRVTNALGQVVQSAYDIACGKLRWATLPNLSTRAENQYDDFCRLTAAIPPGQDASGAHRRYAYFLGAPGVATDVLVRAAEPHSPTGWVDTHILYDGLGRRLQQQRDAVVDGARVVIASDAVVYDARGRGVIAYPPDPIQQTLVAGAARFRATAGAGATRLWYDSLGRIVWTLNSNGTEKWGDFSVPWQTAATGECGNDPSCEGARTVKLLDAHGNVAEKHVYSEGGAPLAKTRYTYDAFGRTTATEQWNGVRWLSSTRITTKYDSLGRKIEIDDPDSGRWRFGYDLVGNLVYQDDPETRQHVELCYDELNRLTQKHLIEGSDAYLGASLCANPASAHARYVYDDGAIPFGVGRLARVEDASGFTRFHAYDALGNPLMVEKGIQVGAFVETATTAYSYDRVGHLARIVYPDGERVDYEYDESGNVRSLRSSSDGAVLLADLTYDRFGRPRQITHGNGNAGIGVIDTREYHDESEHFRLARLTTTATAATATPCGNKRVLQDMRYTRYTANGRIAQIDHTGGACGDLDNSATYRYDGMGRLLEVTGNNAGRFAYDALGNLVTKDGKPYSYPTGRPHRATAFGDDAISYDRNGNRAARDGFIYRYDAEDRLVDVNDGALQVTYDHAGSRVRQTAAGVTTRFFNELAEFRIDRGHALLTKHYFAGDLRISSRDVAWRPAIRDASSDSAGFLAGWFSAADARNALGTLLGLGVVGLMLLPERRRSRGGAARSTAVAVVATFLSAQIALSMAPFGAAPAWANGGVGVRTVPLPTVIAGTAPLRHLHYHVDHLGSPQVVTDARGAVVEFVRYLPYGEVRGRWQASGAAGVGDARFGFAGYENEAETGLQFAGARWYDPELATFLTHDPARQFPNPYSYGGGDPVNGIDRAGAIFGIDDLLVAVIVGVIAGAVGGGVQAAINGASVGQALKAAAIGGAIGGAASYVGAGFIAPAIADTVVPAIAGQLVQAGVSANSAGAIASVAVNGVVLSAGLSQVGYQAARGNWGPLIGLGVAVGLHAALAPPTPAQPVAGIRTVSMNDAGGRPTMSVGDLRTGDVLITEEGSMASVTGHAAVVLEAEGDVIRVLSADQRGAYIETNIDPAVGGRQWDVFRPGIADMNAMLNRAEMMATRGELRQYLGNFGGNVCSSCVASAVEAGGGPVAPRFVLNLVIPATLRETYGPPIGRVFVPRLENI